ncbi:TadE/TadG family type IV pilus assembly protein [Sphingomonas sp. CJ99]
MIQRLRLLNTDHRGATLTEFGFVAPVLCLLLMGAFDIAHTLYMRAALHGIVQKAARDSSLEDGGTTGRQTTIDEKVTKEVRKINANATPYFSRRFYRTFSDAAAKQPEDWDDTNNNRTCDNSEPYEDANNNSTWDADGGNAGQGGAKDAVIYTVSMEYDRLFPVHGFVPSMGDKVKVSASTVLRNQPYSEQSSYAAPVIRNCPAAVTSPTPTPTPSGTPCVVNALGICVAI